MLPVRMVVAAGVLALVGAACGGGATESAGPAAEPATVTTAGGATSTAPAGAVEVPELLRFTAAAVGGGKVEGPAYAGRPVLLWFWSPW